MEANGLEVEDVEEDAHEVLAGHDKIPILNSDLRPTEGHLQYVTGSDLRNSPCAWHSSCRPTLKPPYATNVSLHRHLHAQVTLHSICNDQTTVWTRY